MFFLLFVFGAFQYAILVYHRLLQTIRVAYPDMNISEISKACEDTTPIDTYVSMYRSMTTEFLTRDIPSEFSYLYKKLQMMYVFANNFKAFDKRVFRPVKSLDDCKYKTRAELQKAFITWLDMKPKDMNKAECAFVKASVTFFDSINEMLEIRHAKTFQPCFRIQYFRMMDIFANDQLDLLLEFRQIFPFQMWSKACVWLGIACGSINCINYVISEAQNDVAIAQYYFDDEPMTSVLSCQDPRPSIYNWLTDHHIYPTINGYTDHFITMNWKLLRATFDLYYEATLSLSICQAITVQVCLCKDVGRAVYALLHVIRYLTHDEDPNTQPILEYRVPQEKNMEQVRKREYVDCIASFACTKFELDLWSERVVSKTKESMYKTGKELYVDLIGVINEGMKEGYRPDPSDVFVQMCFGILNGALKKQYGEHKIPMTHRYIVKFIREQEHTRNAADQVLATILPDDIHRITGDYLGTYL